MYKVSSMKEIREVEATNGFNVASTFSGGGGSSLGYRMAGFNVLYANEFVEEAQKTYRANCNAYLDTRDIREVKGYEILEIAHLEKGELDILDGSPPCCAFSTAGSIEKGWGQKRDYSDGKKQRIDDLFYEYIRLIKEIQPKVFIAENVKGLITGKSKGYFKLFIKEMERCGYCVKAALLNASWLGVPQSRERVIFCGVRNDLSVFPSFPKPLGHQITLREAFDGLEQDEEQRLYLLEDIKKFAVYEKLQELPKNPKKRISYNRGTNKASYFNLVRESMYQPCSTVVQMGGASGGVASIMHPLEDRKFTIPELKRIMSVPDDFVLTGTYAQQYERLGRMVPPLMMKAIAETVRDEILCKTK